MRVKLSTYVRKTSGCKVCSCGSLQEPVAGPCEHCNKNADSVEAKEILDHPNKSFFFMRLYVVNY
jgi:hypothetical protein